MSTQLVGPLLIGTAAILWSTDALFRFPTVDRLDPTFIVFTEHLIATVILLPWVWFRQKRAFFALGAMEWAAAALIGVGGSAVATVFFTASFRYINPSVAILLQKIQPIMVVILAATLLGERPRRRFWIWAPVALGSAIVLTFPDLDFSFLKEGLSLRSKGVLYSLGAAALWALATVAGKSLLNRTPASVATFWRFAFGLGALGVLLLTAGVEGQWKIASRPQVLESLVYMALVPGLVAMVAYYMGLKRTRASVATFVELLFPVGAVALNTIFLELPLSGVQLGAGAALLVSVTMLGAQEP